MKRRQHYALVSVEFLSTLRAANRSIKYRDRESHGVQLRQRVERIRVQVFGVYVDTFAVATFAPIARGGVR